MPGVRRIAAIATLSAALSAALLGALLGATVPVAAQDWPVRPLTMVVPFAAGSGSDILGRIIAPRLAENLGASVAADHRDPHFGHNFQQTLFNRCLIVADALFVGGSFPEFTLF